LYIAGKTSARVILPIYLDIPLNELPSAIFRDKISKNSRRELTWR
jgi:hypothetical protein